MNTDVAVVEHNAPPAGIGLAAPEESIEVDLELPAAAAAAEAASAPAQMIEFARGRFAALPMHTAVELIDAPTLKHVPGAAYYCDHLLAWRGRWLPLLNLEALLAAHEPRNPAPLRYALVVAWQGAPRSPLNYGALALPSPTRVVQVSDAAQCVFPDESDLWPLIALSCFRDGMHAVPILDTTRLFSRFHG